jgi:hypothetical protein
MSMREFLNKSPLLGWGVAAGVAVLAVVMFIRGLGGGETSELTQEVTIRCKETGKEWKMPRGAMEKQLMLRPYPVNADEGLINPDTGKPTGFPVDDWKRTVEQINASREPLATGGAGASAPQKPGAGKK